MVSKFSQIENTLGDFNIICFQNPGTELIMRLDILCLNWTIYCKMQERLEDSSKQWTFITDASLDHHKGWMEPKKLDFMSRTFVF